MARPGLTTGVRPRTPADSDPRVAPDKCVKEA